MSHTEAPVMLHDMAGVLALGSVGGSAWLLGGGGPGNSCLAVMELGAHRAEPLVGGADGEMRPTLPSGS